MLNELRCRRKLGQHHLGVPRKSRGMDTALHLCSPSLACSYCISQIQSKKLCSVRGRLKSSNPGLVQCIFSLVSSLPAALEESARRIYPIPAGGGGLPACRGDGQWGSFQGKCGAQLQELSQSEKCRCLCPPFPAEMRR